MEHRSCNIGHSNIVFTYNELREAIEVKRLSTVYLGYCAVKIEPGETVNNGVIKYTNGVGSGTSTHGIKVPATTTHLTIIGTDPRPEIPEDKRRVTLVDADISDYHHTISVSGSNQTITIKDINIRGSNQCGVLFGYVAYGAYKNTTFNFKDVNYTGPAMAICWGEGSLVTFEGCNVNLRSSAACIAHEACEAPAVSFRGYNSMKRFRKADTSIIYCPVDGYVTVEEGALLEMETDFYLFYPADPKKSRLTVKGTLKGKATGTVGCLAYANTHFNTIDIPKGGRLELEHNDEGSSYSSVRCHMLNVEGTLIIDKKNVKGAGTGACIYGFGYPIKFNNPELIMLTNAGAASPLIHFSISHSYKAEVINFWPSSDVAEKRIWNDVDISPIYVTAYDASDAMEQFRVTGLNSNDAGVSLKRDHAPMDAMTADTFCLTNKYKPYRVVMGRCKVSVDSAMPGKKVVSGRAPSGSTIVIREFKYNHDELGPLVQTSGTITVRDGRYTVTLDSALMPDGNRVYAFCENGPLEAHTYYQGPDEPRGLDAHGVDRQPLGFSKYDQIY